MVNQASTREKIQGGNTQCKHSERKSLCGLCGSGNIIPQESGCLLYSGDIMCSAGVVFVAEEWIGKNFEVQSLRQNHLSELIVGHHVNTILCVNAPQTGLVMRLRTYSLISLVLCMVGWGTAGQNQMLRVIEPYSVS